MEIIGTTIDDAAGEAFDKCAKVMGLPYPGGPVIDQTGQGGRSEGVQVRTAPRRRIRLLVLGAKTSFLYTLRRRGQRSRFHREQQGSLCASLQKTIVEILLDKLVRASKDLGIRDIAIAGGVSGQLRTAQRDRRRGRGSERSLPEFKFTTDNAAMIAMAGYYRYQHGNFVARRLARGAAAGAVGAGRWKQQKPDAEAA